MHRNSSCDNSSILFTVLILSGLASTDTSTSNCQWDVRPPHISYIKRAKRNRTLCSVRGESLISSSDIYIPLEYRLVAMTAQRTLGHRSGSKKVTTDELYSYNKQTQFNKLFITKTTKMRLDSKHNNVYQRSHVVNEAACLSVAAMKITNSIERMWAFKYVWGFCHPLMH